MKVLRLRWVRHINRTDGRTGTWYVTVQNTIGKLLGKRSLGKPWSRLQRNFKLTLYHDLGLTILWNFSFCYLEFISFKLWLRMQLNVLRHASYFYLHLWTNPSLWTAHVLSIYVYYIRLLVVFTTFIKYIINVVYYIFSVIHKYIFCDP